MINNHIPVSQEAGNIFRRKTMQNKLIHLDSGFALIDGSTNRIRVTVAVPGVLHYQVGAKVAGYDVSLFINGGTKASPIELLKKSGLCKALNIPEGSLEVTFCHTKLTDDMYLSLLEGNVLEAQKALEANGSEGEYQDADTILADMTGGNIRYGYEDSGIFEEIVRTLKSVPDRESAEIMFELFTGRTYREVLDEVVKRIGMAVDA